jgi:hypothetical protein
MWVRGFFVAAVWYVAMVFCCTIDMHPRDPVPAVPLNTAPDATIPEPPEPAGDCGSWDDSEECET